MIHLTLTGAAAGQIICGADKRDSVAQGNLHYHASMMPDSRLQADYCEIDDSGRKHQLCLACLDAWNSDDDEGDDDCTVGYPELQPEN